MCRQPIQNDINNIARMTSLVSAYRAGVPLRNYSLTHSLNVIHSYTPSLERKSKKKQNPQLLGTTLEWTIRRARANPSQVFVQMCARRMTNCKNFVTSCSNEVILLIFMAALLNRAGHYIFALWFLSFFLSSSFFLASSQQSQIGCLPYFHNTWCGLSADLER